jgi:arginine-tRNA-protein transferase
MEVHALVITPPTDCAYLRGRQSRLELRLVGDLTPVEHTAELAAGVRRFGRTLFRPACEGCSRCIPIRIPVAGFRPSRSQRRVLRRNRDVEVEVGEPEVDLERLRLHHRFHEERRQRRGWPRSEIDVREYVETFLENAVPTLEFRYRLGGRLVGVAYVDESPEALNSVYAFHAPELARRSLGTFDVLTEIEEARRRGKEHVYLGYYVEGCASMEYKRSFRPSEMRVEGRWVAVTWTKPKS